MVVSGAESALAIQYPKQGVSPAPLLKGGHFSKKNGGVGLLGTHLMNNYGQENAKLLNNRSTFSIANDSQKVQKVQLSYDKTIQNDKQATVQNTNSLVLQRLRQTGRQNKNFCLLTDLSEINRFTKQQNIECLNFFLSDIVVNAKKTLVQQLLVEYYRYHDKDLFYNGVWDNIKDVPLLVQEQYNAKLVSLKNNSLLTFAEHQFLRYISNLKKRHKYIHVWREDPDGGPDQENLKLLETRYSKSYCENVERRMEWLACQYRKGSCVYVVLTIDPKKYGYDKVRMWKEVRLDFANFLDKVRRNFIRRGLVLPPFLVTIEAQKNPKSCGNPHINIVFFGCHRILDWRKIREYWGKGGIRINRTRDNQRVRNPVKYVTKYITKTFCDTNADNVLTQSLVWIFNKKSYSCSRGLVVPMNPKGTGEWIADYLCVVDIQDICQIEYAMIYDRLRNMYRNLGTDKPPPGVGGRCGWAPWHRPSPVPIPDDKLTYEDFEYDGDMT